ncbi:MAG: DUF5717 family protein [Lachnospiraceae bacterium]|nr:DUF5717 family protein [Lachnospiraceae bacterium]
MRKKIYRLSEDQFDTRQIKIISSVDRIDISCNVGSELVDSFVISGEGEQSIRGVIYSTNPYIIPRDYQFDGVKNTIQYALKHNNFQINDTLSGEFIVVANGDSIRIPINITFTRKTIKSSIGEIANLNDFGRLCQENFIEANHIFHTDAFIDIIDENDIEMRLLYRGYKRSVPSLDNLEEFLVAARLKERIDISLNKNSATYESVVENQKEEILITKSTWGNVEIDVTVDADFVTIEKDHIDSDYFLGSMMHFDYYIHKNRMHKGTNLAKICFDTNNQHMEYIITARLEGEEQYVDFSYQDTKNRKIEFVFNYIEYRLRHITTSEWASKSIELLDTFITDLKYAKEEGYEGLYDKCDSDIEFYELMKAHAYIANGERQQALWIIQKIKRDIGDKKSVKWAYLLYLCTLIEREPGYVDKLTQEIEVIFRNHPDDVRVFWYLLFLREEYTGNTMRKLKDILQWLNNGYDTPYLYVEAYTIYRQEPHLIKELSDNVIKILGWSSRHSALTEDMCEVFINLLSRCNTFDERIYKIACEAYEVAPSDETLEIITGYLLRTNSYGEKFLRWYELCLYKEMRITGVYEAYLMCLDGEQIVSLPQVLLMYFKYQSNLSYDKKAIVYSNVILHKKEYPNLYQQYLRTIETFAIEQMERGRIDDSLAIIYQDVLDNGIINEDVAASIAPLLHTARISMLRDDITRVLVIFEQLQNPVVATVRNNVCFVPIYAKNYAIFLEDKKGVLHSATGDYRYEFLLRTDALADNLKKLSPQSLPYVIRFFDELRDTSLPKVLMGKEDEALKVEDLHSVETFISSKAISIDYKCKLYPLVISFLRNHGREEMIEKNLIEDVPYERVDAKVLSYIVELFVEKERYDRAFYLISTYNACFVSKKCILKLCEYMIDEEIEEAKTSFFVSLLADVIGHEPLGESALTFMSEEYVGPTDRMVALWKEAHGPSIDTHKLEDRILVQMFYSEDISDDCHDILKSYVEGDYNKMLLEAVLTYFAHEYILDKADVLDEFDASLIFRKYNRNDKLNDSCKIGLMKHLCLSDSNGEKEINLLDNLVREYVVKNIYFAFYKKMEHQLIVKYHLYDKKFVEYLGKSNERINIVYKKDEGEVTIDEMPEMYPGLYVKQFVIFFGDNIYYEVHHGEDEEILSKDVLVYNDIVSEHESRYDMINKMQSSLIYYEEKDLLEEMKTYQGLDYVTRQLFTRV